MDTIHFYQSIASVRGHCFLAGWTGGGGGVRRKSVIWIDYNCLYKDIMTIMMLQVVWTDQFSTLLTLGEKRIIDDERMVLDRPHTKDWNLLLHDVKYDDKGRYTCQINTMPIKTKTIELIVLGTVFSSTFFIFLTFLITI